MDIYKCPKSETQKNFPSKNFNILNNKLKKVLKADKKRFPFYLNLKYTYIH
jgi:predicted nucleic-acid-binding Zn-ribbon protein